MKNHDIFALSEHERKIYSLETCYIHNVALKTSFFRDPFVQSTDENICALVCTHKSRVINLSTTPPSSSKNKDETV